jgi:uncharacterized protein YciW
MFETEIRAALVKAGLAENLYNRISVKSIDEIEGAITALKSELDKGKTMTETEFLDSLKANGQDELLKKYVRREADRLITEAIKTHDKKKTEPEPKKETMTEEQKKIAELEIALKTINDKLDGVTTKLTSSEMDFRIKAELKKAGLSEDFADLVHAENAEKITDAVTSLKTRIEQVNQADINRKLESGELAAIKKGSPGTTLEESKIAEYAKSLTGSGTPKTPDFQGKLSETAVKE